MYAVRIVLLLLQSLAVVEASVKWTLHSSCYRTKDGQNDDSELEKAMIDAVSTSKAWAKRGSEKLKGLNGMFKKTTKEAMQPLLGKGTFDDNVKDVIDRFNKLDELEGPIGKDGAAGKRYDASTAWADLKKNDPENHYLNFLLVCRPDLVDNDAGGGPGNAVPYDLIRDKQWYTKELDLSRMLKEENDPTIGNWNNIPSGPLKIKATTNVDERRSLRKDVPETITFHPLWLQHQRNQQFSGWTNELFAKVTANNAMEVYNEISNKKKLPFDIVPVDGVNDASFVANVFHEFFHLSAFGGMKDDQGAAYGWQNNVKNQDRANPELFAIIAMVIELLNRDGDKYKVDERGVVTKGR